MSGGGADARDAALAEMVGSARYIYTRYKSGARGSRYGGGDGVGGVVGREIMIWKGGMNIRTREYQAGIWQRSN